MPESLTLSQGRLTQQLVDQYWDEGFLFPIRVISESAAQALRDEFESIERSDGKDASLARSVKSYQRVNAHAVMPMAYDLSMRPEILDVIEGILGPDILVYGVEFFTKEPGTPHFVSMHQDLTYWGLGATQKMITAWLALSPATVASGCMEFVKGSHKNPILPHGDTFDENNLLSRGQQVDVEIQSSERTAIELQPGEMSLHHGLTIHGSGPNISDDRRIGVVIRYMSTDVRPDSGLPDYAALARGNYDFSAFRKVPRPSALFAPDALDLYEEIRSAQAKIKMSGATENGAVYS